MGDEAPEELPRARLWAGYRQKSDKKYVNPQTEEKAQQIVSDKDS